MPKKKEVTKKKSKKAVKKILPSLEGFCGANKSDDPTNAGFKYWFSIVAINEKTKEKYTGLERLEMKTWEKLMEIWLHTPIKD